jgi:hypothetical protein
MPRSLMLILRPKKSGAAFTRDRVRLQNQMECLLEMRIKLSIVVSNLLGTSGIRILRALAEGRRSSLLSDRASSGRKHVVCTASNQSDRRHY